MYKLARTHHLERLHRAVFLACMTLSVSESALAAKMQITKT